MTDEGAEKFGGTKAVEESHTFDIAKLEQYMQGHVEGFQGPLEVRQFKGGQSNPTYQLITPNKKYVLRRKPPGKLLPSAHAVDREYRVITALASVNFPVARSYCLCEDESVIGTMFYIMDMVEGRILWDPPSDLRILANRETTLRGKFRVGQSNMLHRKHKPSTA